MVSSAGSTLSIWITAAAFPTRRRRATGFPCHALPMEREPLKTLPENWSKAVAIVAHPDDMEFGAAAAVARWTGQGKHVVYAMVTSGEAGIDGMHPDECRRVREAEEIESARIVGVDTVEFLGLQDGVIEYGVPLRRTLAEVIRLHRPEIILTGNFRDTFGPGALNQADHIAVGRAVLDAARDAGNRWIFADQLVDGLEPWGGVRAVWAFGSPEAKHGVDTTETFDQGVARWPPTRRTSRVSAGRAGTRASSSRGSAARRAAAGRRRSRLPRRCTRSPGAGTTTDHSPGRALCYVLGGPVGGPPSVSLLPRLDSNQQPSG